MTIQFIKNQCCRDGGKIEHDITDDDLKGRAEELINICGMSMGNNCYVYFYHSTAEAEDHWGDKEDWPEGLAEALDKADYGVMMSSNGCPDEYMALPEEGTDKYWQAIIDDLVSCDWGDCFVNVC